MTSDWRIIPAWDCADGTPEEDHDWHLICGDASTGESDYMECAQCGKTREATFHEVLESYPIDGT